MRDLLRSRSFLLLCPLLLFLGSTGCITTTYSGFEGPSSNPGLFERRVTYRISPSFYTYPPSCIIIFINPNGYPRSINRGVERAFERHLGEKFKRVIGRTAARRVARKLSIDFNNKSDRDLLSRRLQCHTHAKIEIEDLADTFLLVWAKRSIKLSLRLIQTRTVKTLFKARHIAQRSNGGLPLTPVGAPLSIAKAASVRVDVEAFYSLADDAARRMLAPLPDLRPEPLLAKTS